MVKILMIMMQKYNKFLKKENNSRKKKKRLLKMLSEYYILSHRFQTKEIGNDCNRFQPYFSTHFIFHPKQKAIPLQMIFQL